ncbi:hypothetical protein FRUB_05847 [Fimbriiglobus ruber]|uniref:Uncharacterized protein n=1 Tax=Fimbriiglobus ruber TaxID=1908690 RepID=A0A225DUY2_9BACT|nr:hypothetical protein FRUB_05847 [Fimbriiglobus ruber]
MSLHDAADGSPIMRLPGLVGNLGEDPASDARVAFSPDGQWMLSTNWDGTMNLWDARRVDPADGR